MRSSWIVAAAAFALAFLLSPLAYADGQDKPFALSNLIPPGPDQQSTLRVYISTTGTAPSIIELENEDNWRLAIVSAEGSRNVSLDEVRWEEERNTAIVSLIFPRANTYGVDLSKVGWRVVYLGSQLLSASIKAPPSGALKAAKGKDDAVVYLFGSALVGPSTKPLYVVDVKAAYDSEIGTSGWFWETGAIFNSNTKAEPPVDKVTLNPDAIEARLSFSRTVNVGRPWLYGVKASLTPLNGEFSRKDALAGVLGGGRLQLNLPPVENALAVYPQFVYEIGHSIKRPEKIDKQPVDLSAWQLISRGSAAVTAVWTLFKVDPDEDDWYWVTVTGSYTARFPFEPEPFVRRAVVDDKRVPIASVGRNTRHAASADFAWNVFKYGAVSLKYKYGAEPPLYPLVDHQWAFGFTIKAAKK